MATATEVSGVDVADKALPETCPQDYPEWVKAFREFKSS
jgi:hypothetical protein